jgi:hypothetical protein
MKLNFSRLHLPSFVRTWVTFISNYSLVGIELILGFLLSFVFTTIGAGAGSSILSGIAAGALVACFYRIVYKIQIKPNTNVRKIGQALVGLTIGVSIAHSNLANIFFKLPILIFTALLLLLGSILIGYIYSHIAKVDLLSAMLAVVPGNIGIMASIAADYGKNVSLVSLVQLIRFTGIILIIPIITNVSTPHDISLIISSISKDLSQFNLKYLLVLTLVLSLTAIAARIGSKFKVPAAYLFCSILVGIVFNYLLIQLPFSPPFNFNIPPLVNLIGQTLLGITIGEYWGINPKLERRTVALTSIPVALTFLAGFTAAGITMFLTHWDWLTCLLMAAPGGSPEMILIALVLNHNVETITAAHLVRLMAINVYLPLLIWALEKYGRESKVTQTITT